MDVFLKTVGALHDETRIALLRFVHENGAVCVCDIEQAFSMIQSRISRHLKILKEAGFLKVERKGRWAYYSVREPLDRYRQETLREIKHLPMEIPVLQELCGASSKENR